MVVHYKTSLKIPAAAAWGLLKQRDTFLFITRGAMRYRNADSWPQTLMAEGVELETVVHLLGFLPGSRHRFRIVRVDELAREADSEESGGFIRQWNHSMKVEEAGDQSCVYHDRVELRAGFLTPIVWLIASVFYRYRQHRWRRLASRRSATDNRGVLDRTQLR